MVRDRGNSARGCFRHWRSTCWIDRQNNLHLFLIFRWTIKLSADIVTCVVATQTQTFYESQKHGTLYRVPQHSSSKRNIDRI